MSLPKASGIRLPRFSIINVPWERQMQVPVWLTCASQNFRALTMWNAAGQTFALTCFVAALPLSWLCVLASIGMLFYTPSNILILGYILYIFFVDKSSTTGKRTSPWFRNLRMWSNFKEYFPVNLIKTEDLPPDGKYILGYHPHGIIGLGAIISFGTESCGFGKLFPGIRVNPVTLAPNLLVPFMREIWLSMGFCLADRQTFRNVLAQSGGRAVAVVIGGAAESLKTAPGTLRLQLARRKGFVRQAFLNEAALVPVLGFGETDAYDVVHWKCIASLQKRMQKLLGFALPLFHGRGVFNYDFGMLPHRRPINVVVGAAIALPRQDSRGRSIAELGERWLVDDEEGSGLVDRWHAAYVEALKLLYAAHKERFFAHRRESLRIE